MSDLSDLAEEVAKDLPFQVRKTIDTAIEAGWQLNGPGMTLALRLNHPTDDLAQPVYITWVVGRTPKGNLSFRFDSCGTRGLVPLSGADLLEYLDDPTVIYPTDAEIEESSADRDAKAAEKEDEKRGTWDSKKDQITNLNVQLGARVVSIQRTSASDLMADQRQRLTVAPAQPQKAPVSPVRHLRVQIPGR